MVARKFRETSKSRYLLRHEPFSNFSSEEAVKASQSVSQSISHISVLGTLCTVLYTTCPTEPAPPARPPPPLLVRMSVQQTLYLYFFPSFSSPSYCHVVAALSGRTTHVRTYIHTRPTPDQGALFLTGAVAPPPPPFSTHQRK